MTFSTENIFKSADIKGTCKYKYNNQEIEKVIKKVFINESDDIYGLITFDGTIKYINDASEMLFGITAENLTGKKIFNYLSSEDCNRLTNAIKSVLNIINKSDNNEYYTAKLKNNRVIKIKLKNLLHEPLVNAIAFKAADITESFEFKEKLSYISTHDAITGLPNSNYFIQELAECCRIAKDTKTKFALMMLDIDGLKNINYMVGYDAGNNIIIDVVNKLKAFLGKEIFISRFTEAHFAIIIQGLFREEYEHIAEGIIKLFLQPFKIDKFELNIYANMGICFYPENAKDIELLKKLSMVALLRSKKEGRNKYKFYSSGLDFQTYKEFIIRNDLHHAIEKNQLRVYYQPMINLETNEIIASEVLIRWEHPDWGILTPDEFIPLAEETGLIIDVGDWILKEVCRNYKQWMKAGLPNIKISINFSCIQFFEDNFVENIINTIQNFEIDPNFLIMEITESTLMKKADRINSEIKRLQSYGIKVALDDFGTGFSSLKYLYSLNINMLKIDSSFIQNINIDKTCTIITKTIVKMAQELNIDLVAEGIENSEQLNYLKELNCYYGQGFLFSRPVPIEEFVKMLDSRQCIPILNNVPEVQTNRRKFFRIDFHQLLESVLTVIKIKGKSINVGNTKVLVKNIGPGGLCFISNIKLPVEEDTILQFKIILLNKELELYGHPVRAINVGNIIYEYGVKFTINEAVRENLNKILIQVQIKMKNDILFDEGKFITCSAEEYFM